MWYKSTPENRKTGCRFVSTFTANALCLCANGKVRKRSLQKKQMQKDFVMRQPHTNPPAQVPRRACGQPLNRLRGTNLPGHPGNCVVNFFGRKAVINLRKSRTWSACAKHWRTAGMKGAICRCPASSICAGNHNLRPRFLVLLQFFIYIWFL